MIAVTGATGHLGQLVIDGLLRTIAPAQIVALVRNPAKAAALAARGVVVRQADYAQPATLGPALAGVDQLLLISSSEVGQRAHQHRAVIDAAVAAGVRLVAYTSLLRADTSPIGLAAEHLATERALQASGLPHVLLRNGWYIENHTGQLPVVLQHGGLVSAAGQGRFASATRQDYADAAVAVLTTPGHAGRVYELAGDHPFTLDDFAAEVSRQTGRAIGHTSLPAEAYRGILLGAGLPPAFADLLVDADIHAATGALDAATSDLPALIGRPTTTLASAVAKALAALPAPAAH